MFSLTICFVFRTMSRAARYMAASTPRTSSSVAPRSNAEAAALRSAGSSSSNPRRSSKPGSRAPLPLLSRAPALASRVPVPYAKDAPPAPDIAAPTESLRRPSTSPTSSPYSLYSRPDMAGCSGCGRARRDTCAHDLNAEGRRWFPWILYCRPGPYGLMLLLVNRQI